MCKVRNIIFDLDGTIIDPKIGITKSIQYAIGKLGHEVPETDDLLWCIGPPLYDSFPVLLNCSKDDKELINRSVELYREYYREKGIYEQHLYIGIVDALQSLKQNGYKLYIATSKPRVMADIIMEYHKLTDLFEGIYGCELDGTRSNKTELLAYLLKEEDVDFSESMMVGDRKHDIIGGRNNNLTTCGVLYGYGSEEELSTAKADYLAGSPAYLVDIITKA